MRQFPSHYTFHAGQYLADKEFRYLRTIIVIADVHRRFGDWREPLSLTFRHWSGVTPYTSPYGLAESCVFGKQLDGHFSCALSLATQGRHFPKLRLAFLPSSLTRSHSFTLGYSPYPPVLVCGTVNYILRLEAFLGTLLSHIHFPEGSFLADSRICALRIFLQHILKSSTRIH